MEKAKKEQRLEIRLGGSGGQYSPTTPYGARTTTAPYGMVEHAFDISALAIAAGAAFVARGTVYHAALLDTMIDKAIRKRGFSSVEVLSNCHIQYGRRNRMGSPVKMLESFRDNSVRMHETAKLGPDEMEGKFVIGVLADNGKASYNDAYEAMRRAAVEKAAPKHEPARCEG